MSSMHEVILEFGIQGPPGAGSASAVPDAAALANGRMIAVLEGEWIDIPPPAGTGDMLAAVYDPSGSAADVYDRANHTGNQAISSVTGLQSALDAAVTAGDDAATLGSATAAVGHVLTADGAGGAAWEALTGGGGTGDLGESDIDTLAKLNAILADATLGDAGDFETSGAVTTHEATYSHALIDTALQPLAAISGLSETATAKILTNAERDKLAGIDAGATANASDADLRDRATHTGTQAASTVTGLAAIATTGAYADLSGMPAIPAALADLDTTVKGAQLNADHAKLGGIEAEATADQSAAEVPVTLTATNYSAATPNVEAHLTGINTALGNLGGGHDAVTVTDSSSIDFTLAGQALTAVVLPAGVNHDALAGYVSNEHIDWTTDQGATNVHAGNIPDLSATYSATDHNHSGVYEPADATILKSAAIGSTVQGYDADTAKLNAAQTWTASQAFTGGMTGSAVTITAPGTAQSVALDGRIHVIELADATETTITGTPTGTGYSSAIVRIKGSAAGTGTIAWPAGHVQMNSQSLNATAGAYTDFMLDSHDGSTVLYRGVGVQP